MSGTVLIIDDDEAFRELLRGVFEQAGHTVLNAEDAESGFAVLQETAVGLVVMDQRLPGGETGSQLLKRVKALKCPVPVIVVSGYLNDDTIRDLIRDGVEGIYLKPLNIFALLKRATVLLSGQGGEASSPEKVTPSVGVGGIIGLSAEGRNFLEKATGFANFRRNLLLIGPEGSPFERIVDDLNAMSEAPRKVVMLKPTEIVPATLAEVLEPSNGPYTLVLPDAEKLSALEVDRLVELADARSGASGDVRMALILRDTVEALYDAGVIDEIFYMFLGTNELRVPALREMPEDLVELVKRAYSEAGFDNHLDGKLRTLLLGHEWAGNQRELDEILAATFKLASPGRPEPAHFEAAFAGPATSHDLSTLRGFLGRERERYLDALQRIGL